MAVEASSPALIEKTRTVVTDSSGRYQITELRPGIYTVTFTLPGFNTVRREGLELNTGFTATVNADMRPGGVEETITVTGASPVVDITNARPQAVLTREVLDALPTSKSVQALAAVTLGALTTGALGGGEAGGSKGEPVFGFAQIHGSQNGIRTLDGMKLSSAYNVSLASRNQFNQMMVQEIVMETSAASAETESSGMNSNMVPKDGGNQFRGSFNLEGTNNSFQSDNLNDELRARGLTTASQVQKIYDVGFGFGGPIKQDKLWFYGAVRSWGSVEELAGVYFNANQAALSPRIYPQPTRRSTSPTRAGRRSTIATPRTRRSGSPGRPRPSRRSRSTATCRTTAGATATSSPTRRPRGTSTSIRTTTG